MTTPTLLTVKEVADMFRVSGMTVRRMVESGELDSVWISRSLRIPEYSARLVLRGVEVETGDYLTDFVIRHIHPDANTLHVWCIECSTSITTVNPGDNLGSIVAIAHDHINKEGMTHGTTETQ